MSSKLNSAPARRRLLQWDGQGKAGERLGGSRMPSEQTPGCVYSGKSRTLILKVWSPDQHQHHLGICCKCHLLVPTPHLPNQKYWPRGPATLQEMLILLKFKLMNEGVRPQTKISPRKIRASMRNQPCSILPPPRATQWQTFQRCSQLYLKQSFAEQKSFSLHLRDGIPISI